MRIGLDRAMISSRILKPRGLRVSRSNARLWMAKKPDIGSEQWRSRFGKVDLASTPVERETTLRATPSSPPGSPPAQ